MRTKLKNWQRELDFCITDILDTVKKNRETVIGAIFIFVFLTILAMIF